jgi:twinkle protein
MIAEFNKIGIEPKGNRPTQKVACPNCVTVGKTHTKDTCLSIDLSDGLYNCHKCGWSGCVKPKIMKIEYSIPSKKNFTKLSDKGLQMFIDRGITQSVVMNNKIAMSTDSSSVIFPYLRNDILVNYKQRFIDKKDFRQAVNAEAIMFNYDRCKNSKEIIVCEGEFDAMAFEVAGFEFATSVNQGAPNVNDKNIDKKLECITNCYEIFEQAEKIYIATDNDENGRRLRDELIRRFGEEKCLLVDFKECKDANEYLLKYNHLQLAELIKTAKEVPIEGIFTVDMVFDSMLDTFRSGKQRGSSTYWKVIDEHFTWRLSDVNIWTGYQNEGKSTFLESLCILKSFFEGWKWAVFSPENTPINDFYDNLIEMYIGMSSDPLYKSNQMSESDYFEAAEFIKNHFFVIYPENNFEFDNVLDKAQFLVKKYGVRGLIIDPYNTVEHKMERGEREDLYISRFMSKLKKFAVKNSISVNLVAHQLTPQKDGQGRYLRPDTNRIKGGGTFADKADNVMYIWRPERALDFSSTAVIFGSQKIKKQKLVGIPGDIENIQFDRKSNRYYHDGKSPFDTVDELRTGIIKEKKSQLNLLMIKNNEF